MLNGDVCADFPLLDMVEAHKARENTALVTVMATEATRQQSLNYGCIVEDKKTHAITHYVEKPSTFVSPLINCGVYVCSISIFQIIAAAFTRKQEQYYRQSLKIFMEAKLLNIFSWAVRATRTETVLREKKQFSSSRTF